MILGEKYTLSNGVEIPKLGLGTWFISNKDVDQAVVEAVKIGYRHIDTAQAYRNESGVGDGIRAWVKSAISCKMSSVGTLR